MTGGASTFLRVAIVGSGPSGFYAAQALLGQVEQPVSVDLYDRLPTPFGLVRAGVAPDHPKIKSVTRVFDKTASLPGFRFYGNVEIGRDVAVEELEAWYDAVVYAVGAPIGKKVPIDGRALPGSLTAAELVGWYNGHPDFSGLTPDLSTQRAVIIGNGNVALDVARLLAKTHDEWAATDIADHALDALAHSSVQEIVVLGRRGPAEAAFTNPELVELGELADVDVVVDPKDLPAADDADETRTTTVELNLARLAEYAARPGSPDAPRKVVFRFFSVPKEIVGTGRVEGVRILDSDGTEAVLEAGLIVHAVGHRAIPLPGVHFDHDHDVYANVNGRLIDPEGVATGHYVAGWAKRGPTGVIGTNKQCATETVGALLDDLRSGRLRPAGRPDPRVVAEVFSARGVEFVDFDGWTLIDADELRQGALHGRPRIKLTSRPRLLEAAGHPPVGRRYPQMAQYAPTNSGPPRFG